VSLSVVPGIDVSHHQGTVDWKAVAGAGISFAYAKATEGTNFFDSQFAPNWKGMQNAGIIRGAYHFFRPAAAPKAQAGQFVSTVESIEVGDLPPVLDLEEARTSTGQDEWQAFPIEQRIPLALEWLEEVEEKLGRRPLIYTRSGFVKSYFGNAGQLANYLLWIAHYTPAPEPNVPTGWANWAFWQYSDSGQVSGIVGRVDLDRFNGSVAELTAFAGTVPAGDQPGAGQAAGV